MIRRFWIWILSFAWELGFGTSLQRKMKIKALAQQSFRKAADHERNFFG